MSSLPCFAPSIIGRLPQGARGSRGSDFKRRRRRYSPFSAFKSSIALVPASARGEALGDDLGQVAGTSLDKGVELDALARWIWFPLAWRHIATVGIHLNRVCFTLGAA